ncbi:MAG: hypothetical protein ACRDK3_05655 [Actinomycetota bacterium]
MHKSAASWSTRREGRILSTTRLLPAPDRAYDIPTWSEPKIHKDFHIEVLGSPAEILDTHHPRRAS